MELRNAGPDDIDEICALIVELAAYEHLGDEAVFEGATLAEHLFGEQAVARVVLIIDEGAVAGFALWWPTLSTFLGRPGIWLEDLFVRPEFRGRGHGRAVLERLRSMTDGRIEWNILDWNERAIAFYERLTARPVEGWTTYRWLPSTD